MKNYLHVNKRRRLVFNNRQNFFFSQIQTLKKDICQHIFVLGEIAYSF